MIQLQIYITYFSVSILIEVILSGVPCAIQSVLVGYLSYIQLCVCVNPKLLIYPSPLHIPFGSHKFVFDICKPVSVL